MCGLSFDTVPKNRVVAYACCDYLFSKKKIITIIIAIHANCEFVDVKAQKVSMRFGMISIFCVPNRTQLSTFLESVLIHFTSIWDGIDARNVSLGSHAPKTHVWLSFGIENTSHLSFAIQQWLTHCKTQKFN